MSLNLNAVMDGLGTRLATIPGLRVFDYTPDSVSPPSAMVGFPTDLEYDATKGRGIDRCVVPVMVVIGRVSERAARDAMSLYLAGSGDSSVKTAIELDSDLGGAAQSVRVTRARTEVVTIGGVEYLGATFDTEVYA